MDDELKGSIDLDLTNNQFKEVFGATVAAVGTIISAVGNTPLNFIKKELRDDLDLYGNILQATGNALEADGQGEISLEKIGNEIQTAGNSTVIMGLLVDFEKDTKQRLNITGNWMQALGSLVALGDEFEDSTAAGQTYNIMGNLLQSIGNSLQAVGGTYELRNNDKENQKSTSLVVSGSWIQAIGSVLSLIGQIKEESKEDDRNNIQGLFSIKKQACVQRGSENYFYPRS